MQCIRKAHRLKGWARPYPEKNDTTAPQPLLTRQLGPTKPQPRSHNKPATAAEPAKLGMKPNLTSRRVGINPRLLNRGVNAQAKSHATEPR